MQTRLFKYPCSYLIYSKAFDQLPAEVKERLYQRMWDILSGKDTSETYQHLSPETKQAILEILAETRKDLPVYWRKRG